jgi:hypothetical protein
MLVSEIERDWLQRRVTVEQAEEESKKELAEIISDGINIKEELRKPFGYMNKRWDELKNKIQEGDVLWEFRSPEWTWSSLCGRAGLVLLRGEEMTDFIITSLN